MNMRSAPFLRRLAVERFRQTQPALNEIPEDWLFCLSRDKSLTPEDMLGVHEGRREVAARVVSQGIDVLHYFHAGPTCAAALVGAEFPNGCRVVLYQHDHGNYLSFGPLKTQ
jgi:hypothetical protein